MEITDDVGDSVLKFSGDLAIDEVEQMRGPLLNLVRTADRPAIDLSAADNCDTAAFQLLLSACKTAERAGKRIEFVALSPAIIRTGEALGLRLPDDVGSAGSNASGSANRANLATGGAHDAI